MTDPGEDVAAPGGDTLARRRKRALYRAQYRGTKEMDFMLGRYAEARLDTMSVAQLETFEALLQEQDPEINAWLFDPAGCRSAQYSDLIADLRAFNSIG